MKKHSAGIIVFRQTGTEPEVLLGHMGAPWWAKKETGAWSIPKGEIEEGENPLETAKREFGEELGLDLPEGDFIQLGSIEQPNNKTVSAWAIEADIDASNIKSNTFNAEWPPKSGQVQEFPEIDQAGWFSLPEAAEKAVKGQGQLFERLAEHIGIKFDSKETEQGSLF